MNQEVQNIDEFGGSAPQLYTGGMYRQAQGKAGGPPNPPKLRLWNGGGGEHPRGDTALPAASPSKGAPKEHQKTPKMVKNQPQMEALGPRVCGGGGW